MKRVASLQPHPGETDICDIQPNQKSRDDLPAVLRGVQCVCCDRTRRPELFVLIEEHVRPGTDRDVGRRGRDLWEVLVVCILAARPELGSCSFGEGFHSRAHRAALYGTLKLNAPPRKGRLTGNDLGGRRRGVRAGEAGVPGSGVSDRQPGGEGVEPCDHAR